MKERLFIIFVLGALFVAALASPGPMKRIFSNHNDLDFSFSENDHTLRLQVYYPAKFTDRVEDFAKSRFATAPHESADTAQAPGPAQDSTMSLAIRTRPGFVELWIEKEHNSHAAQDRFRAAVKDLERNMGRLTSNH